MCPALPLQSGRLSVLGALSQPCLSEHGVGQGPSQPAEHPPPLVVIPSLGVKLGPQGSSAEPGRPQGGPASLGASLPPALSPSTS